MGTMFMLRSVFCVSAMIIPIVQANLVIKDSVIPQVNGNYFALIPRNNEININGPRPLRCHQGELAYVHENSSQAGGVYLYRPTNQGWQIRTYDDRGSKIMMLSESRSSPPATGRNGWFILQRRRGVLPEGVQPATRDRDLHITE